MRLTIESWSRKNIQAEIEGFSHVEKVKLAVFCAEKVVGIFESKHPDDKRPRLAIEAAKEFTENPTDENKRKCKEAAADAYAADAYAADAYAADAYAAYAAADAADAADAAAAYAADAYAAYAAADAADADAADAAAAYAADNKFKCEVISYINSIKNRVDNTHREDKKPEYTQEMANNGELPPVGSEVALRYSFGSETAVHTGVILFASDNNCILATEHGECHFDIGAFTYEAIDTRTDKEKLIDDIAQVIGDTLNYPSAKDVARVLVEKFDITLK